MLIMTDWMDPADIIIKFTHDILDFCASDPNLLLEMLQERENFLARDPEKYHQTEDVREIVDLKFEDYYIYSYTSDHYQKKPLEVFLLKMLSKYNLKDQKILQGFQDNIFSSFTVSEAFPGSYFVVQDLISGNKYKIREDQSLFQMEKKDYFIGRILPYETGYVLSCVNLFLPEVPYYVARKFWGNLPKDYFNEIDPLEIERIFVNHGMEGEYAEDNLEFIEKSLEYFLKKYLDKNAPSIISLRKKVNRTKDPVSLIKELAKMMNIPSPKEFNTFQKLFYDFWNNTPRDEFQGKSLEEIEKVSMGPLENALVNDLMDFIKRNMDFNQFNNKNQREQSIKKLQEKWLNEPQEELNGQTPLQAIKQEREKIDSPRKDLPISFKITYEEDFYNLDDIQEEDSPVARDVEIFVSYFQENRIKVTQKNRWIPFKHLKKIEKNFINPEKDSFTFIDKEEETGKETRKKYIHFIHLLSRAERLIYTDRRGYVQINKQHFKKFTQNSYGDNILKLLLDWMEKVNWIKLQATEYTTFNAQEYQENIIGIWQFFYQLKPNEKKTPTVLTKDIYADPSRGQKELDEITEYLTHDVQSIILRYLKWFGVIDTQEEVIFPDLWIRSIKQFWVTPKGKKLINRVVRYFWEKGEIEFSK